MISLVVGSKPGDLALVSDECHRVAALCVALGNYHNCGPGNRIAPEYVSVTDAVGMARLCVEAAKAGETDALGDLRKQLEKRAADHRRFFRKLSASQNGAPEIV